MTSGRCCANAVQRTATQRALHESQEPIVLILELSSCCRRGSVTGPSLTSSTCIMAWNSPVATGSVRRAQFSHESS